MINFDHNATTPLSPEARQAWLDAAEQFPGNPSSPHRLGSRAEAALNEAREHLAAEIGADPGDLLFTSGASESNNAALHHLAHSSSGDAEIWLTAFEHPSLLAAAQKFFPKRHRHIPVDSAGVADLNWIEAELARRRPALVAVMAANNETGVLQPWREAFHLCRAQQVPFFSDAAQWMGKLDGVSLGELDYVSGCAHKFGGPKAIGFLKVPGGRFHPLIVGGPQEDGRRAGTENVPGAVAMAAALRHCRGLRCDNPGRVIRRQTFEQALLEKLPGSEIVGGSTQRLWNTVSAIMPPTACEQRWVVKLDRLGFAVSTGSACASGKEAPSHVLMAMGYAEDVARRVLRFSCGWNTTDHDWNALLTALEQTYALFR